MSCSHPQTGNYGESSGGINSFIKDSYSDTLSMPVIYATDRQVSGDSVECNDQTFGVQMGEKTVYGRCEINVPKKHSVGLFEVSDNPRSDPHTYFRTLNHKAMTESDLRAYIAAQKSSDILVFVHGFNVKFSEAVYRASQLAYDLKFQGPVILFTWPAGAGPGFLDSKLINRTYEANKAAAAASIPQFAEFAKMLASLGPAVHLLVHSMGHQVVLPALSQVADQIDHKFIGELILNAPDFPVQDFASFAPKLEKLAQRITVYCSYNDNAIAASETYNGGRRMGACERVPGIDVINVGEIDAPAMGVGGLGHGYYASRPILTDVFQVLLRIDAEKRLFVRKSETNSPENYFLRP